MAATITHLANKQDKLRQDQAERLRRALQVVEAEVDVPPELMRDLFGVVERRTASRSRWTFVMLSPSQNAAVVRYLRHNSSRPLVAMELWALCFEHLRQDTGEILLTRDEMAERLGQTADHVSCAMGELAECGAIIRHRERVRGMRGPGMVRYFMNPRVATHLSGAARDQSQKAAPAVLSVMQGGKAQP